VEHEPDLILRLWATRNEAMPALRAAYVSYELGGSIVHLRKESAEIRWDLITPGPARSGSGR
jgi:hypothetical protein